MYSKKPKQFLLITQSYLGVKEPEVLACSGYTDSEACGYRLFVVPPGIEPDFPG